MKQNRAGSGALLLIAVILLAAQMSLTLYGAYVERQRQLADQELARAVTGYTAAFDKLLSKIDEDYVKAVYDDPSIKGAAQQQFRATEFSMQYIAILVHQNNRILELLAYR